MKIFKYSIDPSVSIQHHFLPKDSQILSFNAQGTLLCFWAAVDPDAPQETRKLACIGTGWQVPGKIKKFIGTVVFPTGLVFHLLEVE